MPLPLAPASAAARCEGGSRGPEEEGGRSGERARERRGAGKNRARTVRRASDTTSEGEGLARENAKIDAVEDLHIRPGGIAKVHATKLDLALRKFHGSGDCCKIEVHGKHGRLGRGKDSRMA